MPESHRFRNGAVQFATILLLLCGLACNDEAQPFDGSVGDRGAADAANDAQGSVDGAIPADGSIGDRGAADATNDAPAPVDGAAPRDGEVVEVSWAFNLVFEGGESAVQSYLEGASEEALYPLTQAFYDAFGDDYDFLYLLSPVATGTGRFSHAFGEPMPAIGLNAASDGSLFGSEGRLQGVIALRLNESGNGPTLHETLHRWGVFLDDSFGFGRDRENRFGPHWGVAGVRGQHGGFDGGSLTCADGSALPCEASGRFLVSVDAFGPAANGGDAIPYAPIELYLMGLVPATEVPSFPIFRGASFLEEMDGRMRFEIDDVQTLTIDDIVAVHGEQDLRPADSRAFRGAFVLVTDAPASDEQMAVAERWSRVFGGDQESTSLLSFEDATGGRATMNTSLP